MVHTSRSKTFLSKHHGIAHLSARRLLVLDDDDRHGPSPRLQGVAIVAGPGRRDFNIGADVWGVFLLFILESNLGGGGPVRGLRGEEEGGGVRSGPGAARTILLFHTISARPPKQTRMVGTFLKVHTRPRLSYALRCRGY
jgi:hypothetical protein